MKLIPYLYFAGDAEAALNFYKDAFNGEIGRISRFSEGPEGMPVPEGYDNKIMHAQLNFGDCTIYFSDGAEVQSGGPHSVSVDIDSVDQINAIYEKLSDGAQIHVPIDDQFWGARYGKLTDKFGVNWDLNHFLPQEG